MFINGNPLHGLPKCFGTAGSATQWIIGIMAIVAAAILLVYMILPSSQDKKRSQEISDISTQGKGRGAFTEQLSDVAGERRDSGDKTAGGAREGMSSGFGSGRETVRARPNQPALSYDQVQQLIQTLAQMKPRQGGKFSPEEIAEINRLLSELKRSGVAGSMAIREFLQSGQDVSFLEHTGKTPPEYGSLRLALIDALSQIGGPETAAFMVGMLQTTSNPEEAALLARGLEQNAPGAYRAEILQVARNMLDQAVKATPGQYPGLGHLFGMIQDHGDEKLARDLEKMYHTSPSTFTEFALMALSKLPEGYGIPSLLRIVNEMSGNPSAYGITYDMALRYLTQASREYPEAGKALMSLANANKINTSALIQVANALGGTEYGLITKSSELSRISRAEMGGFRVVDTWTDTEIDQRLDLIDKLLRTNPQPAAVKALQDARNRLLVWKDRPMVGGKRVKQ